MTLTLQHDGEVPELKLVQLSKLELMAAFASRECPACGAAKVAGTTFCSTDYLALPLHLRSWLSRGPADAYFVSNYNRALNHLRLQPHRQVRVLSNGVRWRHDSHESLVDAGYRLIEYSHCGSPRCCQRIAWYWTPDRKRMAINFPAYTPHSDTCKDPGWFERMRARRKQVRTSAKRKRRA
jgi:hypothetical protein